MLGLRRVLEKVNQKRLVEAPIDPVEEVSLIPHGSHALRALPCGYGVVPNFIDCQRLGDPVFERVGKGETKVRL